MVSINGSNRRIYYNGKIYPMDVENRAYDAISILDGIIEAAGSREEVMSLACESTEMIDLDGRAVIPGITDTHTHFFRAGLSEAGGELFIPHTLPKLLSYVNEQASGLSPGEWIHLRNTYPLRIKEQRFPTIEELDRAAPQNPVLVDGAYSAQANTCALRVLEEKTGGLQMVAPGLFLGYTGELSGIAGRSNRNDNLIAAIKNIQERYGRYGITCVIDGMSGAEDIEAVNRLYTNNELGIRIRYTLCANSSKTAADGIDKMRQAIKTPREWGWMPFLKVVLDGGILTCTSYMDKPYNKKKMFFTPTGDFRGIINFSGNDLHEFINIAIDKNMQMTAHSIGDAACRILLDSYSKADAHGINGRRFALIHGDFTSPEMLERFEKMGVVLFFQPAWDYMDAPALTGLLDDMTMDSFLPYRQYVETDIHACAGSDHMVKYDPFESCNPYNPFIGIYNMVTGKNREGTCKEKKHTVSRHHAVEFYTKKAAYSTFEEDVRGTLEPGRMADFAVLSEDVFNCPAENIKDTRAVMTVTGGNIVYEDEAADIMRQRGI